VRCSLDYVRKRIPPCVNVPCVVWGCQSGCTKWWLYEVSLETSVDVVRVNCDVRSRSPHAEPHGPARDLARGQGQGRTVEERWINGEQGGELRFEAAEEFFFGA